MVAVTMPQPAYRNSLYSCLYLLSIKSIPCSPVWLSRPSDMCLPQCKPSPNLPSCGRRNCCLFSTCVFRGQDSVLCTLQRGAAQIRIRNDLGLTCVFCLCMAGVTASNLESHQCSCQSSSQLLLLLCGSPLTLLKSVDRLYPGRLASSTDEVSSV